MILQALCEYYRRKEKDLTPSGFGVEAIPFIFEINQQGELQQIQDTYLIEGKKKRAKSEWVPQRVKKSSNIAANLLWDNAEYALGLDAKGNPERVKEQHAAFIARIEQLKLTDTDQGVKAVLLFLSHLDHAALAKYPQWESITTSKTSPLISFRLQGERSLVCQSRAVQAAIQQKEHTGEDKVEGICLLTGEYAEIERLHPAIQGVRGAQSAGANIVSFNLEAFTSYGKKQNYNAPISVAAADAYTKALNHLLSQDSSQRLQVGDATMVFWAEKQHALEECFTTLFEATPAPDQDDPDSNTLTVAAAYRSVKTYGRAPSLAEETSFYVLGLAPNAARISIRFWQSGTIKELSNRIVTYFEELEIERNGDGSKALPLKSLLRSIALLGKVDNIPPNLAGDIMHCILEGLPYPTTLLSAAIRRIRAEHEITYTRAAIIKAYLNRNLKEKLTVSLDPENPHQSYHLGRLFAALEKIQENSGSRKLNTTILDRYYGAASATPITVFPTLIKLKNHHISKIGKKAPTYWKLIKIENQEQDQDQDQDQTRKAENPARTYWEIQLGDIFSRIQDFPPQLSLEDQGRFAIGYYHQRNAFFRKQDKNPEAASTEESQGELTP